MGKSESFIFLYLDSDPNHSQKLMESKLNQNPSFLLFHRDPTSSICLILLTNYRTNTQTLLKVIPPWLM